MSLFHKGSFISASGKRLPWKIDCASLTQADWETIAWVVLDKLEPFGGVHGIPTGGMRFAEALRKYATHGPVLLADDVWTTGGSIQRYATQHFPDKKPEDYRAVVAFARSPTPLWVTAFCRTME